MIKKPDTKKLADKLGLGAAGLGIGLLAAMTGPILLNALLGGKKMFGENENPSEKLKNAIFAILDLADSLYSAEITELKGTVNRLESENMHLRSDLDKAHAEYTKLQALMLPKKKRLTA